MRTFVAFVYLCKKFLNFSISCDVVLSIKPNNVSHKHSLAIDGCRRCLKMVANTPFSALQYSKDSTRVHRGFRAAGIKKYLLDTSLGFCFLSVWGIG